MAFDRNNPADLLALKNEVLNDPLALGYNASGAPINEVPVAEVLPFINAKDPQFIVGKPFIAQTDVRAETTYDAYDSLAIDEQEWIRWVTGSNGSGEETLKVTVDLRQKLAGDPTANDSIWAPAQRAAMNAAMLALMDVEGSRAEDLWGYATRITAGDWAAAANS